MVRKYQRIPGSRPYRNYKPEDVENAVKAVQAGMSVQLASQTYKVPRPTISRKLLGRNTRPVGHPTVLSTEEERLISHTLGVVAEWGFPLSKLDVRDVVKKFLDKQGRNIRIFHQNTPGPDFIDSFMQRNNLTIRTASNIKRSRSSVSREDINNFFNNALIALDDVKPENLYNYDETNITDDPGAKKVIVPRNTRRVERVQEHSRASISLMVCGNANGDLLPPMTVYKAQNLYENWTTGGPPGSLYANSPSGWFDMNLFEQWFDGLFLPHVQSTRAEGDKVVLIGDNLASHFSPKVIQSCQENNIYMTPFPPNATHLMQPLDVAVFGPMKKKWRQILNDWRKESRYPGSIPKEHFPTLLQRLWTAILENMTENLKSGFRATGLHPPNPEEVLSRIPDETQSRNSERILDSSLIELLKEHRGSGTSQRRKRGQKVQPGSNACNTEENDEAIEIEELETEFLLPPSSASSLQNSNPSVSTPASSTQIVTHSFDETKAGSSGLKSSLKSFTKQQMNSRLYPTATSKRRTSAFASEDGKRPKLPRKAHSTKVDDQKCGICRIEWTRCAGKGDWIQCISCKKWICYYCNEGSKEAYFSCSRCEDSDDFEVVDDSDEDKDFVPV